MLMIKLVLRILLGKGGADMMAMLWATKIILGKKKFSDIPAKLKEQVREILIENGLEELLED